MMCQVYETEVMPHRTTTELRPTFFPDIIYNTYPGDFAESLTTIKAVYFSGEEVIVVGVTSQIYWPSYGAVRLRFSVFDGSFISREDVTVSVGFLWTGDITQGANGRLYITQLSDVYRCDDNYVVYGDAILPATYGLIGFNVYYFDELRDRAVVGDPNVPWGLAVCKFSTGALLHSIRLPDYPKQIVQGSGTQVYVLLENRAIVGLDYETGQIYSYLKLPQIGVVANTVCAWNDAYRRILICELTPDNPDGSSTTVVKGFRYVAIPTHVCKPIPLKRLRNGVKSPVLIKQIGDLSEGVSGLVTVTSDATVGRMSRAGVYLDGDGEGLGEIVGVAEGTQDLELSSEVACLL